MTDNNTFSQFHPQSFFSSDLLFIPEEGKIQENEEYEYQSLPAFIQTILDECKDSNSPCSNKTLIINQNKLKGNFIPNKTSTTFFNNFNLFSDNRKLNNNSNTDKKDICIYNMTENYMLNVKKSYRLQSYLQENPILYRNNSIECEICFHRIQTYGILCNCENVFCYDCIKLWRNENLDKGKRGTARKCPICGVESNIVIKSKSFLVGEEKKRRFNEFKQNVLNKNNSSSEKGNIIL
jgi:hypothetical protein